MTAVSDTAPAATETERAPAGPGFRLSLRIRAAAVVLGTWLLGALVFFYAQWTSGFNRLMGNDGDTRLIVYLDEHWYLALKGDEAWKSPTFFYPVKGLLGYTDSFFLWQIFYAPFRLLGADPFLAFQLSIVAMSLMAFVCFFLLVRRLFRAPLLVAVAGALVFAFANNLADHSASAQMFSIYFVPPLLLMAHLSWSARSARPALSIVLGTLVGVLWGLLLFSNYYVGWFSLLAVGIVAVMAFLISPRRMLGHIGDGLRSGWRSGVGLVIGFGVGLVPFLVTYLPVVHQLGVRTYADAMYYAPKVSQIDDVGTGNLLYGHLFKFGWQFTPAYYEASYALTPILLVSVTAGGLVLLWALVTRRVVLTPARWFILALCMTTVIIAVLPLDSWFGSPWKLVWHLPGATAIRAIDRIQVANDLVAALALVGLGTEAVQRWRGTRRGARVLAALVLLLTLVVVEQLHDTSRVSWTRDRQLALIDSVPRAPLGCTSFYVTDTKPSTPNAASTALGPAPTFIELQTAAMVISQKLRLPTINGYSGENPPGWGALYPQSPDYPPNVLNWTTANGVTAGLCQLDIGTMEWQVHPRL